MHSTLPWRWELALALCRTLAPDGTACFVGQTDVEIHGPAGMSQVVVELGDIGSIERAASVCHRYVTFSRRWIQSREGGFETRPYVGSTAYMQACVRITGGRTAQPAS